MANRFFADISSNNSGFNGKEYRAGGHLLVAIKATQGPKYINPDYRRWVIDGHNHGLAVLHYHFAETDDAVAEAKHFLGTIAPYYSAKHGDHIVLDLETSIADPVHFAKVFDLVCFSRKHRMVLYSYASYLTQYGHDLMPISKKLWVADYADKPERGWWGDPWAWQRSDGVHGPSPHACSGIGKCDVSRINRATYLRLLLKWHRRHH